MSKSRIQIIISGDKNFNPDLLTRKINVIPDNIWKIGDRIGNSIITRRENSWVLSTEYFINIDISEHLEKLFDKIMSVENLIRNLVDDGVIEVQASIVIYVIDELPSLNFNPDLLERLTLFHASLDIDVILQ